VALSHEEPDRVPVGELIIDYPIVERVLGRPTFYRAKFREEEALWDGRRDEVVESYKRDCVELVRRLGLDIAVVDLVPREGFTPRRMKRIAEDTYQDRNGRIFKRSSVTERLMPISYWDQTRPVGPGREYSPEDFVYRPPERPDDSCFEMVRHVREELGDTHFVAGRAADIGWPTFGRNRVEGFVNVLRRPDVAERVAEVKGRRAIATLDWWAEEGVDAVFSCADYSCNSGPMFSPRLFRRLVFPWIKRYCDRAHQLGMKVFKHACGNNWLLMDMFVEAGYDVYQGIQGTATMDIGKLKERYGGRIALWGGVQCDSLVAGTPEDVRRDAEYALAHAAPGGGYIYGSSHSILIGTRYENYMAMLDVVREKGRYPIKL